MAADLSCGAGGEERGGTCICAGGERLERIKELSEATSYAEIIRAALQLYEAALEQESKGSKPLLGGVRIFRD